MLPEEQSAALFEAGAEGVEILSTDSLSCFVRADRAGLERFLEIARREPYQLLGHAEVEDRNWIQECEEVWKPLSIGRITIRPIVTGKQCESPRKGEIQIVPGLGFGTGHHATTSCVIALLQTGHLRSAQVGRVLDMGTGSGILGLACREIFRAQVEGLDIDEAAIRNARENIELNRAEDLMTVRVGSFETVKTSPARYDLILANIYAEVLCAHESDFASALRDGGLLLLSGIMQCSRQYVFSTFFGASRWRLLEEREEGGWVTLLMKKGTV